MPDIGNLNFRKIHSSRLLHVQHNNQRCILVRRRTIVCRTFPFNPFCPCSAHRTFLPGIRYLPGYKEKQKMNKFQTEESNQLHDSFPPFHYSHPSVIPEISSNLIYQKFPPPPCLRNPFRPLSQNIPQKKSRPAKDSSLQFIVPQSSDPTRRSPEPLHQLLLFFRKVPLHQHHGKPLPALPANSSDNKPLLFPDHSFPS